jgi:hypothetical protein
MQIARLTALTAAYAKLQGEYNHRRQQLRNVHGFFAPAGLKHLRTQLVHARHTLRCLATEIKSIIEKETP